MCKLFVVLGLSLALAHAAVLPDEPVKILSQEVDSSPEGNFRTKFETENGINYQEEGTLVQPQDKDHSPAVVSQGSVSYTSPDGTPIQLTWVADDTGFHPQGDHLPVAPPAPEVPPQILRALEYIAAHPYTEPAHKK